MRVFNLIIKANNQYFVEYFKLFNFISEISRCEYYNF